MSAKILLVEDDLTSAEIYCAFLALSNYEVSHVTTGYDALHELSNNPYSIVLLDLGLPDRSGFDVLDHLQPRIRRKELAVIVISGDKRLSISAEAMRKGAHDFLIKPFDSKRLLKTIQNAAQDLPAQIAQDSKQPGTDAFDRKIREAAANHQSIVFMTGINHESKAVAARKIHAQSNKRDAAFIKFPCSAVAKKDLEVEIFGDDGAIVKSEGGTLFLDEIDFLPEHLQKKILYFLENKGFQALPSGTLKEVNCRVICGASKTLSSAVNDGSFNQKLYAYLCTRPLSLPNLMEASSAKVTAKPESIFVPESDQPHIMVRA